MNNLVKIRKEKNMTRPELSKKSGVPVSTIHKLEIGVNDMRGAKADTLYKLANALDTTVEYLLQYYLKPCIGSVYEEAELKCIVILNKEWETLDWKPTGYNFVGDINTYYDVAIKLGYTPFAKINMGDYCYIKNNELVVFRQIRDICMAKLNKTIKDAIENDGVICNCVNIESMDQIFK